MASFYPRPGKREAWARASGVTAVASLLHVAVLALIEPPQVDPAVLSQLRVESNMNLGEGEADPSVIEVDDVMVDLDCQGVVALRTLGRLGLCELRGGEDACRDQAWSSYRIDSVGCREPLATPALAEMTPTTLVDSDTEVDLLQLPPLEELIDPPPEEEEPEEAETTPLEKDGQVVEIARPNVEIRPDKAEFVAEYDSKVEKQTIKRGKPDGGPPTPPPPRQPTREPQPGEEPARVASEAPGAPGAASEAKRDLAPPAEAPGRAREPSATMADGSTSGKAGAPGALSMRSDPVPQAPVGESFGSDEIAPDGLAPRFGRRFEPQRPQGRVGEGGENGGRGGTANPLAPGALRPSSAMLNKVVAQGSDDYLPGIDEGEGTALNAKRWKHASFFNRVKGQVRQNWNPQRAYRLRDPNGNIYGTKDRLTVVTVSLKPDGTLNNVWIAQPSGVDFLDDEAVSAFRAAQPFPNPPDALVDGESRLITFRFGFMFQINNRAGWKVFRYR